MQINFYKVRSKSPYCMHYRVQSIWLSNVDKGLVKAHMFLTKHKSTFSSIECVTFHNFYIRCKFPYFCTIPERGWEVQKLLNRKILIHYSLMKYLYIRYIPASFPGNPSRRNVYVSIFDLDVWSNFDISQP